MIRHRSINVLSAFTMILLAAAPAQARDGWFGSSRKGDATIFYGDVPKQGEPANAETIALSLGCGKAKGTVSLFVTETNDKLKPGQAIRVIIAINGASHTAPGRTLANELAGVPSVQATFPATAKPFALVTESGTLALAAGAWTAKFALRGIGARMARLIRECGKEG